MSEFLDDRTLQFTSIFKVMAHLVLQKDDEILNVEEIGSNCLLAEFIYRRKEESELSIWDPISRWKLCPHQTHFREL